MNCFRHPDEIAIVFCQACRNGLCRQCSQQSIRGVTHVCSDECARKVRRRPNAKSLFDNVYAALFLMVLLAVLGGGFCAFLASSGRLHWELQQSRYYSRWDRFDGLQDNVYRLFHFFGIEDWRMHFAIGATVGVVCAVVWLKRYWRPTTP
jgi:predicted nucleic acid-binding Zn ribbon protein